MTMIKMTATKALKYGTRRLEAGDVFEARKGHARVLEALKRAKATTDAIPPIPAALKTRVMKANRDPLDHDDNGRKGGAPKPEQSEDLFDLRAQYERVVGRRPFMGWDAAELRKRIANA